ncbi:protein EFFECTOR OF TRANSCRIPTION 2-like [Magnolia sinica]|uniref:protein EFFECTOR OF TRANSCRIPTION 2-like n=1 Tax=Magnolia sinica TaxID=86752 RepID=UPI00265B2F00|nr:protein EFFECTOR OF TRANSCRIPTION 2-like [Magnolia sinica]
MTVVSRAMAGGEESSRLKREECKHTKHDPLFSRWEILIGPSDWENHSLGTDGVERYRIHNLPISCSCPGLYELGIPLCHTDVGRKVRELHHSRVVVVYLGQAENVRTRLQHYGRAGSHLDHGNSISPASENKNLCLQRGPGLFREIFSKGFPIVFRWAPMKNKKEAEKTESQLLGIFDYAWNKGGNGIRRQEDVVLKLNKIASGATSDFLSKFQQWKWEAFGKKRVGIKINDSMPSKESETTSDDPKHDLGSRVFKFSKSRPQVVPTKCVVDEDFTICRVALGDGSVCRSRPVEGRKRCGEHKGKRINASVSTSVTNGEVLVKEGKSWPQVVMRKFVVDEDFTICGVALCDGSVCRSRPVEGRKRCGEHKWKRINASVPTSVTYGEVLVKEGKSGVCGVRLGDGSVCMEFPVHGRKRCELHKGRRVTTHYY